MTPVNYNDLKVRVLEISYYCCPIGATVWDVTAGKITYLMQGKGSPGESTYEPFCKK